MKKTSRAGAGKADNIAEVCAMYYDTAVVTSVCYIGGQFQEAPAVIRVGYENKHHGTLMN